MKPEIAIVEKSTARIHAITTLESVREVAEGVWNIIATNARGRRVFLRELFQLNRPQLHHIQQYQAQFPNSFMRL